MSSPCVHQIVSELITDDTLVEGYQRVAHGLGVPLASYRHIENNYKNGTTDISNLLHTITHAWLEIEDNGESTVSSVPGSIGQLCKVLMREKFVYCAERLLSTYGSDTRIELSGRTRESKRTPLGSKWWPEIKPLPLSFVERESDDQLLVDIVDKLLNEESMEGVIYQKACISGLGGIGKTTLVKWYANHFSERFRLIVWLDCGGNSLPPSINRLWDALHKPRETQKPCNTVELARSCYALLQGVETLIIFDNAEEYVGNSGIREMLPNVEEHSKIVCLITSRCTVWGNKMGLCELPQWQMGTLLDNESVQLLRRSLIGLCKMVSDEELQQLATLLAGLPLALQISIGHLNQHYSGRNDGVRRYIEVLTTSMESLLIAPSNLDDYEKGVMVTLSTTVVKLKELGTCGEMAMSLLCSMAYLEPTVPLKFLASIENLSYDSTVVTCDLLRKYSLVNLSGRSDDYEVSIHCLLQASMKQMNDGKEQEHYSRILSCELTNPHFAEYKLKMLMECKCLETISTQTLNTANQQIVNVNRLPTLDSHRSHRYLNSAMLLQIHDEMNREVYKPPVSAPNLEWNHSWCTENFSLTKADLIPRPNFYYNACLVSYFQSEVFYRLGENLRALDCAKNSKAMALKILSTGNQGIVKRIRKALGFPKSGMTPVLDLKCVLSCSQLLESHVLLELSRKNEAFQVVQEAAQLQNGVLILEDNSFPHVLRLELIRNMFNSLHLFSVLISKPEAEEWMSCFSHHQYSDCTFHGLTFIDMDGNKAIETTHHKVLPTKSRKLTVAQPFTSPVRFHMSQIWHLTEELEVRCCTIVWDLPDTTSSKLTSVTIHRPVNRLPENGKVWDLFPNLHFLRISKTNLPLSFIPKLLQQLTLCEVDVTECSAAIDPVPYMSRLSVESMHCVSVLRLTRGVRYRILELLDHGFSEDWNCSSDGSCPVFEVLKSSPKTTIYDPESRILRHINYKGLPYIEGRYRGRPSFEFEGTADAIRPLFPARNNYLIRKYEALVK